MRKLKQLMQIIAQISPFKPNYSDLARDISVNRSDLKDYLFYMEKSGMIQSLVSSEKGLNLLSKVALFIPKGLKIFSFAYSENLILKQLQ